MDLVLKSCRIVFRDGVVEVGIAIDRGKMERFLNAWAMENTSRDIMLEAHGKLKITSI